MGDKLKAKDVVETLERMKSYHGEKVLLNSNEDEVSTYMDLKEAVISLNALGNLEEEVKDDTLSAIFNVHSKGWEENLSEFEEYLTEYNNPENSWYQTYERCLREESAVCSKIALGLFR